MPEKLNLTPGMMIGAYRITERIGAGGFSEVWSGWDTHLSRLVAVKLIPRAAMDAHNTIQFGREAAMVTKLEHPHILPLYDFGETPEYRYLVMRYVTGGSLAQRIERERLPINEVVRLMTPIASTLDYIHEQRVVHRDLKPGNILLDAQNLPYLTDFGLAKQLTDETRPMHSASGTLTYMPPEQFSGGAMSVRSDQYSFGILLYQLFTGQLPYEGKVALGMRQLSTQEPMGDVTQINPHLPARLNEFLWALTNPDPEQRPGSATDIMKQISEIVQGLDGGEPVTVQGITYALESGAYRQREAESLIEQSRIPWEAGQFALSLTHFVLLDIILRDIKQLTTSNVKSLMLRGALEYGQNIDNWWRECNDAERQRACWHAIAHGSDEVSERALALAANEAWRQNVSDELLNKIGKRLMPVSDYTAKALDFLEKTLPIQERWQAISKGTGQTTASTAPSVNDPFADTDDNLQALATSRSPLAERAARLIGKTRRTRAMLKLSTATGQANPILIAFETAGSLPSDISSVERFRLSMLLGIRQLFRKPLRALGQYVWAALGSIVATGLMIYIVYRAADPGNIFSATRTLNTLGLGLLYGLIYGAGVWLARHIGQRLRVLPYWPRAVLAIIVGGLVVAFGFNLFQQLVYQDVIDPGLCIACGMLYVAGFAISIGLQPLLQVLIGMCGVTAAYIIPWNNYLINYDMRPPFIFDESNPQSAIVLAAVAAFILALLTLGYKWREIADRELHHRRQQAQSVGAPTVATTGPS